MTSLMNMNDVALEKILKKLDLKTILILRQVCHGLRNFIDDSNLKTDLTVFSITVTAENVIKVEMRTDKSIMKPEYDDVQQASEDIMSILYLQKSKIPSFSIYFDKMNQQLLDNVEKALKSKPRPLQVENFNMRISKTRDLMQVLPHIDPKFLKSVSIFPTNLVIREKLEDIDKIMDLEQFRRAKMFSVSGFLIDRSVKNFLHFERFYGIFDGFSVDEIMLLKEAFINSPHMKYFGIDGHSWDRKHLEETLNSIFQDSGTGMESINYRCNDGNVLMIEFFDVVDNPRLNFMRKPVKFLGDNAIIN